MAQVTFMFTVTTQPLAGVGLFQKRLDGSVSFYRDWSSYKYGFGYTSSEFWLGLENIRRLTSSEDYELRIDMEDFTGTTVYAEYTLFEVGSEGSNYKLNLGSYSGNFVLNTSYLISLLVKQSQG